MHFTAEARRSHDSTAPGEQHFPEEHHDAFTAIHDAAIEAATIKQLTPDAAATMVRVHHLPALCAQMSHADPYGVRTAGHTDPSKSAHQAAAAAEEEGRP
jgi:hypothetical protein